MLLVVEDGLNVTVCYKCYGLNTEVDIPENIAINSADLPPHSSNEWKEIQEDYCRRMYDTAGIKGCCFYINRDCALVHVSKADVEI